MKKFLLKILSFSAITLIILEVLIRLLMLTNDVPQRDFDKNNLQVFQKNQKGISHGEKWNVNSDGFLGHNDKNKDNQLLIIGDSFVENIMNPFECRQSSLFKKSGFDVFEIGRSGITFIEALEFYSKYKSKVNPKKTILIIDNFDFNESIQEIKKLSDRTQISLVNNEIIFGKIKGKYLKKILYNYKTLYYTYLKYLKSNKNENPIKVKNIKNSEELINKLITYSSRSYDLNNCLFAFRGKNNFKELFNKLNLEFVELNLKGSQFMYSEKDSHWNCQGHIKASELILSRLND